MHTPREPDGTDACMLWLRDLGRKQKLRNISLVIVGL